MSRQLFAGYKLTGQDVARVEMVLLEIQKSVAKQVNTIYKRLLKSEIQTTIDNIALNIISRPTDISIFDMAKRTLDSRIAVAMGQHHATQYNFEISAHIMFYDRNTYIKLNILNTELRNPQLSIQGLSDFSCKKNGNNEQVWIKIMEKYSDSLSPLGVHLLNGLESVAPQDINFDGPAVRAAVIARHNLTNRYLRMYAGGNEIPNYKLMEYMDEALNALTVIPESETELQKMEEELLRILPKITVELITELPAERTTLQ